MVEAVDATRIKVPESDLDEGDYDPFEVFDQGQGAGKENPYPEFAEKRRTAPVEGADMRELHDLDGSEADRVGRAAPQMFTLYGYDEVVEVLRDAERFSSSVYEDYMGEVFGHSILEMDGDEHHRHRALVAQAFRPKVLARWEEQLIEPVIHEQIDTFVDRGAVDLQDEFTFVYPVKVIAGLLGVPLEHWNWYRRRAVEIISLAQNWDRAIEAAEVLREYFTQIIELRRVEPRGDLISELVQAELEGERLSTEEILPFLMLLSPAGAETTFRSTGNLLVGLFTNPDQLADVRADRSLLRPAIEEAIRWEAPLTFIQRRAAVDTTVGGVEIPAGSDLTVGLGSANRDESVWGETADQFDLHREPKHHVAFATGPHMCLGMHLARTEMQLAMNALFDRLPNLRLDPDQADEVFIDGIVFRSPNKLPVVWDTA